MGNMGEGVRYLDRKKWGAGTVEKRYFSEIQTEQGVWLLAN